MLTSSSRCGGSAREVRSAVACGRRREEEPGQSCRRSGWSCGRYQRRGGSRCSERGAIRDRFACPSREYRRGSSTIQKLPSCSSLRFAPSEILVEFLAEFEPRAQEPRLHRRRGNSQDLGRFFGGKALHVAQKERDAENGIKLADHGIENFVEFRLRIPVLRRRTPVLDLAEVGVITVAVRERLVKRDLIGPPLAQLHQSFVDGDAHE